METIQVVIDTRLLSAVDKLVRRTQQNRSALIREALREHLRRAEIRELEARERKGFTKFPPSASELLPVDLEEIWLEE